MRRAMLIIVGCAFAAGVASGCSVPQELTANRHCAPGPARPVSVTDAARAFDRAGLRLQRETDEGGDCTPFIVANFNYESPPQSTFCVVEKSAAPRMRENPVTIFSGKNASGKAREIVFQNVTCVIYTSSSADEKRIVGAAISAMRELGGKRV